MPTFYKRKVICDKLMTVYCLCFFFNSENITSPGFTFENGITLFAQEFTLVVFSDLPYEFVAC